MTAVGVGTCNCALRDTEFLCEVALQTGGVESCKGSELAWLQTGVDESCEGCHVSRVEDYHNVLYVRAVLLDIVTELSGNLAVAFEKVLSGHTFLAWGST